MKGKKSLRITNSITGIIFLLTSAVMISWFLDLRVLLTIFPNGASMKFNTALLFWLIALILIIRSWKKESTFKLTIGLNFILLLISGYTFMEYILPLPISIDNIFVVDHLSEEFPGRMSPATALSFILSGIGLLGILLENKFLKAIAEYALLIVSIITLITLVSYFIGVSSDNKTFFIHSMAVHTAALFFILVHILSLKNNTNGFTAVLLGPHVGSRLLRTILIMIIGIPLILGNLWLYLTQNNILPEDFAIALYSVLLILSSLLYVTIVSIRMNKSDINRKRLESNLRSSNQELMAFKKALDATAIVAITNNQGKITYVNDNFCTISGYTKNEVVNTKFYPIYSDFYPKSFYNQMWHTISNGKVWIGEIKNQDKNNGYYWVHTSIIPFKDKKGEITQYLTFMIDITSKKEAEELLSSQYVQKLEQKNRELEQFAYIASHDLQEPLRTVKSFINIINEESEAELSDNTITYFNYINQSINRMSEMVKGLLEYSRVNNRQEYEKVDTNTVVDEVVADLSSQIKTENAQVIYSGLPEILIYRVSFRMLIQNLISNAIKFRKPDIAPVVQIVAKKEDQFWKFCISDNGIGIDAKYQERIFVLFQRLHNRSTYEGTGIGLSLCQKIVHLHGGNIWVESDGQNGSKFFFTIPVSPTDIK